MTEKTKSPQKNLILGLVKTYPFEKIKPFLVSLKKTGYQGDVCFFVSDLTPETLKSIQDFGVQTCPIEEWYLKVPRPKNGQWEIKKVYPYHLLANVSPFNRLNAWLIETLSAKAKNPAQVKAAIATKFVHVMCVRYPLYYLYLLEHGHKYSHIMLTDVRDVLFQRDPFEFEIGDRLCCFFEEEGKTLNIGDANTQWIREGFGAEALAKIGEKRTSCSGTTLGSRDAILKYLEVMVDHMVQLKAHTWGIDQGVHNYILHQGLIENVTFYQNYQGPILTMHYSTEDQLRFDDQGLVLNQDGSAIHVLHQYDRQSPEMKSKMLVYRESECVA